MTDTDLPPAESYAVPPATGLAVTALVLGIGSFVCLGPLVGIPAIIVGVVALSRIRRRPAEYGGKGMATAGVILGAVNLVMLAALIAMLLPALAAARDAAKQSVALSNARQIMVGFHMYASEHDLAAPPHLSALVTAGYFGGDPGLVFVDPATTTAPLRLSAAETPDDWRELAPRFDNHCDYLYTGAGLNLRTIREPSTCIILYTRDVRANRQRVVGFADGHTASVAPDRFTALLAQLNEVRRGQNLPPLQPDTVQTWDAEAP